MDELTKETKLKSALWRSAIISLGERARGHNQKLREIQALLNKEIPEDLASDFVYEVIDFDRLMEELGKDPVWLKSKLA